VDVSHAVLEELRMATGGGLAFLFALAPFGGARKQCLDMAVGDSDLSELGISHRTLLEMFRSLRAGAAGRAILAHLPEIIQERVLSAPAPASAGPGAYRDNAQLLASLEEIRRRGFAVDEEECAVGWVGCAAPVKWDGLIMGAVSVLKARDSVKSWPGSLATAVARAAAAFTPKGDRSAWSSETPGSY
jgi:DNA-binding IclR family transcriptional regulator